MFERTRGGNFVAEGTYLKIKEGEFVSVPKGGDFLPGATNETFINIPLALVLVLGPLLGLLFVLFLPFAVPLVVVMLLFQRVKHQGPQLRDSAIERTTLSPRPGLVYFKANDPEHSGRREQVLRQGDSTVSASALDDLIEQLEDDIQRRRERGEN